MSKLFDNCHIFYLLSFNFQIPLTLKVFGKQIQLNLHKNNQIVPTFKLWEHDATDITKELSELNASDPCYYFHKDNISISALNFRQESGWVSVPYKNYTVLTFNLNFFLFYI